MNATFYNLIWEKGQSPYLEQGVKGNKRPRRALYGGNGSYMVAGDPARLYLSVLGDDGKIYRSNIYGRVMKETGRQRMSEKLYDSVYNKFQNATFAVDSNNYIEWSCKL